MKDVDEITRKENEEFGDGDFTECGSGESVTSEEIKEVTKKINKLLEELSENENTNYIIEEEKILKKLKKTKHQIEKKFPPLENKNTKIITIHSEAETVFPKQIKMQHS